MEKGFPSSDFYFTELDRPSWNEYFAFAAIDAATRASCKYLKTGCVVVKNKRIIATGYNGAPPGIKNCLERGCRKDEFKIEFNDKGKGACRGKHAEKNALDELSRAKAKGSSIYTVYYPCSVCAKDIVGKHLVEVVYLRDYDENSTLALDLFEEAGITLRKFNLDIERYFELIRKVWNQK
jgi:dCMP deaminase